MKFLYITLFIVLPSVIFAQSNYHEGLVVKNNGDTLKGYIDYREWGQNPISIDFKVNKNDKQPLTFNPKTIKSFQITGMEAYASYSGIISMNKNRFPDLPEGLDSSKKQATIFLKQLVTGDHITLFSHTDELKTRFFIAETNKDPIELMYSQYYADQKTVNERNIYRGQLLFYINKYNPGNNNLINKAEHSLFELASLEHIVNNINGISPSQAKNNRGNKPSIRLFAGIGVNYTKTKYSNPNFFVLTGYGTNSYKVTSNSQCVSPQINLGFDLFVNPNVQQLIFRTALSFSYVSAQLNYPISGQTTPVNDVIKFTQYNTTITPQLLFNIYNKDSFKLYIDGGAAINLSSYPKSPIVNSTTGVADPLEQNFDYRDFWVSLPLQVGMVFNKTIEVSVTYTPNANIIPHTSYSINNQTSGLGIRYLFGGH